MISRADALAAATIYHRELPASVHGVTAANRNGTRFMIVLNTLNSTADEAFALEHELAHIRLGHFAPDDLRTIEQVEAEADALAAAELSEAQQR